LLLAVGMTGALTTTSWGLHWAQCSSSACVQARSQKNVSGEQCWGVFKIQVFKILF